MNQDPMLQKKWHSKMTEEQIYEALSRDIYEPVGIEYEQFLMEIGLKPELQPVPPIGPTTGPTTGPISGPTTDIPIFTPEQITDAIEDYMSKDEKDYIVRITRVIKNKLSKFLLGLSIVCMLTTGINITDNVIYEKVTNYLSTTGVQYELEQEMDIEKLAFGMLSNLNMGDYLYLKNGITLNTHSSLKGVNKTIGKEFVAENKHEGDYAITGISILVGDEIVSAIENFNNNPIQQNLGDFINKTLEENSLSIDDVNIRLHFGSSSDKTRGGWCDYTDVITQEYVQSKIIESSKYKGSVTNFEGDYITINTVHGNVKIPIKDANGNYVKRGDKVYGDDNREYIVSSLDVETVTKEIVSQEPVVIGKKISFDITDKELYASLLPLIAAISIHYATKKKNEEYKKNPHLESFDNKDEFEQYKEDFKNEREKHRKNSGFWQKFQRVFVKEQMDEMRVLTDEQVEQVGQIIESINTEYYTYSYGDKFEIRNNRVLITTLSGEIKDITAIVMDRIKYIGEDNNVETVGLLTDELREGRAK